jgi:hypothetical protein
MDLGFHDIDRAGELFGGRDGLLRCPGDMALEDRDAIGFEQLLALIFVNVHELTAYLCVKRVKGVRGGC